MLTGMEKRQYDERDKQEGWYWLFHFDRYWSIIRLLQSLFLNVCYKINFVTSRQLVIARQRVVILLHISINRPPRFHPHVNFEANPVQTNGLSKYLDQFKTAEKGMIRNIILSFGFYTLVGGTLTRKSPVRLA